MAKLTRERIPFTQVANEVLNDKNLSLKAKGLYAYLFSKPDDWDFSGDRIANETKDGRKVVYGTLKELEAAGFLERNKLSNGRCEYHLKFSIKPNVQNGQEVKKPVDQNGKEPKRQVAETGSINNKDILLTKNINNTVGGETPQINVKEVANVIDTFRILNDNYSKWFKNKTQRAATQELIEKQTEQKVLKAIYLAKFCETDRFFPTFTTPYELVDKMAKVKLYYKKKMEDKRFIKEFEDYMVKMEYQKQEGRVKKTKVVIAGRVIEYAAHE